MFEFYFLDSVVNLRTFVVGVVVVVDAVFWLIFSLKRMRGCGSDPYRVNVQEV